MQSKILSLALSPALALGLGTVVSAKTLVYCSEGSPEGFTAEQLYSTASYQTKDLEGIGLSFSDVSGDDLGLQLCYDQILRGYPNISEHHRAKVE